MPFSTVFSILQTYLSSLQFGNLQNIKSKSSFGLCYFILSSTLCFNLVLCGSCSFARSVLESSENFTELLPLLCDFKYSQYVAGGVPELPMNLKYAVVLFFLGMLGNFYHRYLLSKLRSKDGAGCENGSRNSYLYQSPFILYRDMGQLVFTKVTKFQMVVFLAWLYAHIVCLRLQTSLDYL